MVCPKVVKSENTGLKSNETPKPIKEPDGMVSIDLNSSKNKNEATLIKAKLKKSKKILMIEIILGLFLLNITVFGLLIIYNRGIKIFKIDEDIEENFTEKHTLIKQCSTKYPTKLCCLIFFNQDADFTNLCRQKNLIQLENDIDIRKRREATIQNGYEYPPLPHAEPINPYQSIYYQYTPDTDYEYPDFIFYPEEYDFSYNQPTKQVSNSYRASKIKDETKNIANHRSQYDNKDLTINNYKPKEIKPINDKTEPAISTATTKYFTNKKTPESKVPLTVTTPKSTNINDKSRSRTNANDIFTIKEFKSEKLSKETNNDSNIKQKENEENKAALKIRNNYGSSIKQKNDEESIYYQYTPDADYENPVQDFIFYPEEYDVSYSQPTKQVSNNYRASKVKDETKNIVNHRSQYENKDLTINKDKQKEIKPIKDQTEPASSTATTKYFTDKKTVESKGPLSVTTPKSTPSEISVINQAKFNISNINDEFKTEKLSTETNNDSNMNQIEGEENKAALRTNNNDGGNIKQKEDEENRAALKMINNSGGNIKQIEGKENKAALGTSKNDKSNTKQKEGEENKAALRTSNNHGATLKTTINDGSNKKQKEDEENKAELRTSNNDASEMKQKEEVENRAALKTRINYDGDITQKEDEENRTKIARSREKNDVPLTTVEMQSTQQATYNPCFVGMSQYSTPYKLVPTDNNQLFQIVSNAVPKLSTYVVNPPVYPYVQSPFMVTQSVVPSTNQPNGPIQVNGPGGQYYICNPITNNAANVGSMNIANVPGVEIRRDAANLQDLLGAVFNPEDHKSKGRSYDSEIICPLGHVACADNSKCISKHQVCDNEANCADGSDETSCSCKERVGKFRNCDGYFDCPNGEDELGCFGCEKGEFSCDDWSKFRKSTCIPIEQRCDNIRQCEITGKDEEDCTVLTDRIGKHPLNKISNAVGFLHRNFKGKWYPTCFGSELWAMDVCKVESGPLTVFPKTQMVINNDEYDGPFINILPNKEISLVDMCIQDRAAFVECPALFCGMRLSTNNPYRKQEVDTSAEQIINELERASYMRSQQKNLDEKDPIVGDGRVVGGKPSQPTAWPWLVSIYRNGIFHCGGVLIHESWIITAAHCTEKFWLYYYEIQAGMLRRFSYAPMEQHRWAVIVVTNENYDRSSLRNDIALMKLSAPVRFNRYVRPICLPSEFTAGREFFTGPAAGTICTTVGWGATIEHGSDPDHMREVEVPILEHCKHSDDLSEEEICAGLSEGGKDACQGDSGGPLMCRNPNNPNQWYLAGVVSHGEGCARPDEPGVYTKVGKYVGWISENIGGEKFITRFPLQHCPGYICKTSKTCLPKKRRCDKIIDCLFGDDEIDCTTPMRDLFKHARESEKEDDNNEIDDKINNVIEQFGTFFKGKSDNKTIPVTVNNTDDVKEDKMAFFTCKSFLQLIPAGKKCNKIVDCEDGTDELNCTCADYVKSINPNAICDGVSDCYDLSDEQCVKCTTDEYYCRLSQQCIELNKRCDRKQDCSRGEDEWDCVALTDGHSITFDADSRPNLTMSGVITVNRNGVWLPYCLNTTQKSASIVATDTCYLLGFEEYQAFYKSRLENKPLIEFQKETTSKTSQDKNNTCDGLYVRCSNVSLDSSVHGIRDNVIEDEVELYTAPWNAVIYSDGIYRCMGAILNSLWIVTSVNCSQQITDLETHYVVVLLGKGKAELPVRGPHEQTLRIVESKQVPNSDIVLLRTEKTIFYNRYIKHLRLNLRRDGQRKEKCVAIGLHNNKAKYEFLSPIQNCDVGFRCFETKIKTDCESNGPWSGTVICDSGSGWYSAAVYFEKNGLCGISSVEKYTSVPFHKREILKIIEQDISVNVEPPKCDGFRCSLGECINKTKTCNGVPDCKNGEDEEWHLCYENERLCHLTGACQCNFDELKCKNGLCVSKNTFCDRNDDCGDLSDEPDVCDCKSYLQLTNPEKICDGIVHCLDRTDEDPEVCPCRAGGFNCSNSKSCISNEMVCDGTQDCPKGEDEKICYKIVNERNESTNAGELISRTGGVWHSGCFRNNHTEEELESMCQDLGYSGGTSIQMIPPKNVENITTLRPEIDDFKIVWLRRNLNKRFMMGLRTGNEPYVSFVPDDNCYKLYLACL